MVARLEIPVTVSDVVARRVPTVVDEVLSVVISALVAVKLVKNPDTTVRRLEKKLVEVADVPEAVVKLRLVIVEEEIVAEVIVVVASDTVPVATRVPVTSDVEVATPRVDDAVMISDVKVGLADTAIVEVEVRSMLDPAMR